MNLILIFISGVLLIFTLTMAMNLLIFPRLKLRKINDYPLVSVLIPARNEAHIIEMTIRNLLAQTYPNFELLVLDDNSEDGTGELIKRFQDKRLRYIKGSPLATNWAGKPWACWQLAQEAKGEFLVFTDADVQWQSDSLGMLVGELQKSNVDMLTVWPSQITETWAERLTVPLIALVILAYLPLIMVHHSPFSAFAAANGQCMTWRRKVYFQIGGHTIVAQSVLDDVRMARAAKSAGYRIRMIDGNRQIETRMYQDWKSVRDGFAKNILAGYGSVPALVAATVLHWLVYLFPYLLLFWADYRLSGILFISMGISLRAISAWFTRQRVLDAFLMPISVLMMTIIAAQSIYWHYTGRTQWKGRILKPWQKASL